MATAASKNDEEVLVYPWNAFNCKYLHGGEESVSWSVESLILSPMKTEEYYDGPTAGLLLEGPILGFFEGPVLNDVGGDKISYQLRFYPASEDQPGIYYMSLKLKGTTTSEDPYTIRYVVSTTIQGKGASGARNNNRSSREEVGYATISKSMAPEISLQGTRRIGRHDLLTIETKIRIVGCPKKPERKHRRNVVESKAVSDGMSLMFKTKDLPDIVPSAEGEDVPDHECILADRWEAFKVAHGVITEGMSNSMHLQVDRALMEQIGFYLRKAEMPELNDESALAMLEFATQREWHELENVCVELALLLLDKSTVLSAVLLADKYSLNKLREKCIEFICENEEYWREKWEPTIAKHQRLYDEIISVNIKSASKSKEI